MLRGAVADILGQGIVGYRYIGDRLVELELGGCGNVVCRSL